jgi:hypothetical protein
MNKFLSFFAGLGATAFSLFGAVYVLSWAELTSVETLGSDYGSSILQNYLIVITALLSVIIILMILRMIRGYIK